MCHNCWAHVQHLLKPARSRACALPEEKPQPREAHVPQESSPCLLQQEKAFAQQWQPSTAKNKQMQKKKSTGEEWIQGRKCVQINALQFDKMNELVAGRDIYPWRWTGHQVDVLLQLYLKESSYLTRQAKGIYILGKWKQSSDEQKCQEQGWWGDHRQSPVTRAKCTLLIAGHDCGEGSSHRDQVMEARPLSARHLIT